MSFENSISFATKLDNEDVLKSFRNEFYIPTHNGKDSIYLCGNSLGCMPKSAEKAIQVEFDDWKNLGVEGHFKGTNPWMYYHHFLCEAAAKLVGANKTETVVMNQLTSNLHFLLASFYQPTGKRTKIIMEAGAFPSDMYLIESQVRWHKLNPDTEIIEVKPEEGEHTLSLGKICDTIELYKDEVALVFFSGVQYYTGQVFDIKAITQKAHECGALAGFDLAHAVGNIALSLHDWQVDFAAWCSYKYLNSGPGSVAGAFIHEKHASNANLPRLAGWWGHKEDVRFKMLKGFIPENGAQGWQVSNAPVLSMAVHWASLKLFDKAGISNVVNKGKQLNAYLQFIIEEAQQKNSNLKLNIITPPAPDRGCQISMLTGENGKALFDYLTNNGVIADWRHPNVIRIAPVAMYNSFTDIYYFGNILVNFNG